jgi:hypothetical protein
MRRFSKLSGLSVWICCLASLCLLLSSCVHADKYSLDPTTTLVFGEPKFIRAVGMYSVDDSSWGWEFRNKQSYVQLRLTATELSEQLRVAEGATSSAPVVHPTATKSVAAIDPSKSDSGFIQAIILQSQDLDLLGLPDAESPLTSIETYCCTSSYVSQGLCPASELGGIIIDRNVTRYEIWTYDLRLVPSGGAMGGAVERRSPSSRLSEEDKRATYHIRHTGEHVLILSHCDESLNTEVSVTGLTEWKNPFGYLPGRFYGFLNFHRWMSIFYTIICLGWTAVCIRAWKEFGTLQMGTSVALLLCLAEQTAWYTEYQQFNAEGTRPLGALSHSVILSVLRQTTVRVLIVAIALGYQIVRPSLGGHGARLAALGGMYFVFDCALELVVRYQQTHPLSDYYRILLTLPVSILNTAFYWWTTVALYQITQHLEDRKQVEKFHLYRHFTNTLICTVAMAVTFSVYQSYFMLTNQSAMHWSHLWLVDGGVAFLLYTIVLLSTAVLFRPENMTSRFSYAPVAGKSTTEGEGREEDALDD